MTTTEVRPLARMRSITTAVMIGTVGVVGGLVLILSADAWWQAVLVLPSLALAVWVAAQWHSPPSRPMLLASVAFAEITFAVALLVGVDFAAVVPVAAIGGLGVATTTGSRRLRAVALLAMIGATALLSLISQPDAVVGNVVGALVYAVIFISTFWLNEIAWRLFTELDAMRRTEAELAVVKERMRFAADLHDIQGHTLHVIKLKAAVAAKLQHTDPERVASELADIARLTAETIDQAQHLVNSTRELSFPAELANATALLSAAGIEVSVEGADASESVHGPEQEELRALVLREATTNILRHPSATTVRIGSTAHELAISNDGAAGPARPERGLAALRERVAAAGGALEVVHAGDDFTVRLHVGGWDAEAA